MNNGWKVLKLGSLCEVVTKGTTPTSVGHKYSESGINFIKIESISSDRRFLRHKFGYISEECHDDLRRSQLKEGDVLFSIAGALGRTAIVTKDVLPANTNQALAIIRLRDSAEIVPDFLLRALDPSLVFEQINKFKGGVAQQNLSLEQIKSFQVPVPPIEEQRRIVAILDEAFEAIDKAKQNTEKNLQNARELLQSYLQQIFGNPKAGSETRTIDELVRDETLFKPFDGNHGEIHPKKSDYVASGVPFIMACDLKNGGVDLENRKFIPKQLAKGLRTGFAQDGDVLLSHKGTIGRSAILRTEQDFVMLTPQVTSYRIRNGSRLTKRFLRYYFMSPVFQKELIRAAEGGSTRAYVGITRQRSLRITFPSVGEQEKIVVKLDAMVRDSWRLENIQNNKSRNLNELKKSILQKAFIGKL